MILRSGKYKGKSKDWVEDNDPSYLIWVEEFRPEMLKDRKYNTTSDSEVIPNYRPKPLTPNMNFDNEKSEYDSTKNKLNNNIDNDESEPEWNF